jgi:hypothetical protein
MDASDKSRTTISMVQRTNPFSAPLNDVFFHLYCDGNFWLYFTFEVFYKKSFLQEISLTGRFLQLALWEALIMQISIDF